MKKRRITTVMLLTLMVAQFFVSCENKKDNGGGTASTSSLPADTSKKSAVVKNNIPQKLSPEEMAKADSNYQIPAPNLVFKALDTIEKVDWSQQTNFSFKSSYQNDFSRSFVLGRAIADAFIAIQAKNKEKLGTVDVTIFDLAKEIGLEKALDEQKPNLQKLLDKEEWGGLKDGVSKVHEEFTNSIKKDIAGGNDYLVLANIGGWIEGTAAISNYLMTATNPSKAAITLIKQPNLPRYLITSLDRVKGTLPQKQDLTENLGKLVTLFSQKEDLTKDNLVQINTIAKTIINQFN